MPVTGPRTWDMAPKRSGANPFSDQLPSEGSWTEAVGNAVMLDTSVGQGTMFAATANAFGVAAHPSFRRVQEGYSPYDSAQEDLTGFEYYLSEFKNSTSPEETQVIKQMIENNLDLRTSLEDWGGTRLVAGFLDPVNLIPVPFALGKGFVQGAKVALKRGLPIVGVTEAVRHGIDPTSTVEETIFNTLGGGLFMGLMGGVVGKIPKGTMTVGDFLNGLTPPPGTTGVSFGVPWHIGGSGKTAFARVTAKLKSATSYGEASWKQVNPEDMTLHVDDSFPGRKMVTIRHKDGHEILTAWHVDGELKIGLEVPKELQRKGLGSYSVLEAVKYAEKNKLIITSYGTMSKDALKLWKFFEKQGYKVVENKKFSTDADGVRTALDPDEPLFKMNRQIDEDIANQIPADVRQLIDELELTAREAEMHLKAQDDFVIELKKKAAKAGKAGGARTKAMNELEQALKNQRSLVQDVRRTKLEAQNTNIKALAMLDAKTVKDWDLLPTGYNKLLGKLDQMPWWRMLKTPLRDLAPDLAVEWQMTALKLASTPGLNNKGNKLGHNTGTSIESAMIIHTGRWLTAVRESQNIYRTYAGHGEASGQVKHFWIDQKQRVHGKLNKWKGEGPTTTTTDGKLTIQEFDRQVSIAMSRGGKHDVPEVAKAAALHMDVRLAMGKEIQELGISATAENLTRRIAKIDEQIAEFTERFGSKYHVEESFVPEKTDGLEADVQMAERKLLEGERAKLQEELDYVTQVRSEYVDSTPSFVPDHVTKLEDGINDVYITDAITPGRNLADATGVDTPTRVEVLKNPTRRELARWAGRDVDTVRFAVDENGSLYVWNANEMLHETFRNSTNVGSMRNAFFDVAIEPKRLFDELINARQTGEFDGSPQDPFTMPRRVLDEIELDTKARMAKLDKEAPAPVSKDPYVEDARALGIENPEEYVALTRRVSAAEKDDFSRSIDPDTGENLTIEELVALTEKEGKRIDFEKDGAEFSRRRGYTQEEIDDFISWRDQTQAYIDSGKISTDDLASLQAAIDGFFDKPRLPDLPPSLQNWHDKMILEKAELQDRATKYAEAENPNAIHRMWIAEAVKANEIELKKMLTRSFEMNPKYVNKDADGKIIPEHPDDIRARVNEAYAGILHEADTGNNGSYAPQNSHTRKWLEARKLAIETKTYRDANGPLSPRTAAQQIKIINRKLKQIEDGGQITGATGPLISRRLELSDEKLLEMGLIESDVNTWMQHYVQRTAPMIETARIFGDARGQQHIDALYQKTFMRALEEKNPLKRQKLMDEADGLYVAANDLRDIVHGVWGIPDNPDAITPRILRMLRNFNILGAMGRSVMMALGDVGNVVISQGFARSLGHGFESFGASLSDGNIKMMRDEVDLAGSVSEVILGMRYHQMTDFGIATGSTKYPALAKFEHGLADMSQRFFLYNLLGPWTDMARRFSGGMLQSRLIENSLLWRSGTLPDDQITIMNRLGINKLQAIQFADEWEASGSLKHGHMFIANTSEWAEAAAPGVRAFRAAMNTEINRMVPTPGAVDKPKALLKGEWWKVIGQYRGFSIAATHRIMGAGLHEKGANKYAGAASMVGIAMMVDALKRPDYIDLPIEEQLLRAVELSGVTGIFLDLNDTLERAAGVGIRPLTGMNIRERNPNWANKIGVIGAVPNQWLTLLYGLTADEAETDDLARAIRYMIPYNNLLWWNEAFNRAQRSAVDMIEETKE